MKSDKEEPNGIEKTLDAIKYPVSIASGAVFAHHYASDAVYDKLKESDKTLFEAHEALDTARKAVAGTPAFRSQYSERDKPFQEARKAAFKRNGYNNPLDLVLGAGKSHRWRTLGTFLSAASITLGVIMTIADNKELTRKFSKKDQDEQQAR